MKHKFSVSLTLALILAMLVTSLALADTLTIDGDTSTAGVGNSQFELCPGVGGAVTVRVSLKYNGSNHFNDGSVTVTATVVPAGSSFITADSGSLTLSDWGGGDEVFTDLGLAIGSNWSVGAYKVTYTLTQSDNSYTTSSDDNVQIAEKTSGCIVANTPPVIAVNNPSVTVTEGDTATNSGTFSDADNDPVTISASVGTVTNNLDGTWNWSFNTIDGPAQSQTVTITADDGQAQGSATFDLTVNNAEPVVTASWATASVACRQAATLNFGFSDAGVIDNPWTVGIDWDDSSSHYYDNAVATQGTFSQSHTYNMPGIYTATVGVTDKDSGFGSNTADLEVLQTYTVKFLQPFDGSSPSNLITNTMKSGRTVPVKVTIYDDCAQAYVTNPATMVKIFLSAGLSTGSSNDAVEVYADAGASNGDTLYFRWTSDTSAPGGGFWIYNLNSKTALNGSALVVGATYRIDVFVGDVKATATTWALLKPVK